MIETIPTVANNAMPPMRGIKQAIAELKAADPDTALTERALRRLVASEAIPSVKIGRKHLINMSVLSDYLHNGAQAADNVISVHGIRRVAE
ncbi:MAG: hypothetical protein Q4G33_11650 [bacterium]|nr:hypothetical protein [bacterium]